jgi:hypothetical protein
MVLFYCTAVAMKHQDQATKADGLHDLFEPGEHIAFSGYVVVYTLIYLTLTWSSEIMHDRFLHAFRIYVDHDSGCVRFEATARRGPLKTVAIWTAFVTRYIEHKNWMQRISSSTIQFGELHPYVFCDGYRVPKSAAGKYQLTFTSAEGMLPYCPQDGTNADQWVDAKNFRDSFHRIRVR